MEEKSNKTHNNTVLVTVRTQSTRLPKKCLLKFGNYTMIEHILRRCLYYELTPIVCTTTDKNDDIIVEIAETLSIRHFRGSSINKLLRWRDCCKLYNLSHFHSVDADDPFFCGNEVKRSMSLLHDNYDMVEPTISSSHGGATVGYSLTYDIIKKTCDNIHDETNTEMMWHFVNKNKNLNKIQLPEPDNYVITSRMTLDYPEDYIMLEKLRKNVGNFASREEIFNFLQDNRDISSINAFRNDQWLNNQKELK